jgi:SAM-dependent methyltransferase
VFPADYPYSSGNSRALHENFEDLAKQASELVALKSWERVVDIGANDGTLLSKFTGSDYLTGIEPTDQAYKIGEMGAGFYRQPFTEKLANNFVMLYGKAKVVTACNVLAHVHDIHDVMRGINVLLADDGILVTENHDLRSLVRGQWDTVYHEHLRYWDTTSFHNLLMMHGFRAEDWQDIPTHGGSFRTFSVKGPDRGDALPEYDWESLRIRAVEDRDYLRAQARGVAGIGATARATTIINYCGLDVEDVEYVAEVSGSDKIGRYVPGTRIPIVDEQRLFEEQRPAILFSWHMADFIGPKLRERGYTGEMILPLQPA